MPPERMTLVWDELEHFEDAWFEKVCTDWIMNNNTLPMMPYFYEQASNERDKIRAANKARESREAKQGWQLVHGKIKKERDSWDWTDEERKEKFGALIETLQDIPNPSGWQNAKTITLGANDFSNFDQLVENIETSKKTEYDF